MNLAKVSSLAIRQRTDHLGTGQESVNHTLSSLCHSSSPTSLFIYGQEWFVPAKRAGKSNKEEYGTEILRSSKAENIYHWPLIRKF